VFAKREFEGPKIRLIKHQDLQIGRKWMEQLRLLLSKYNHFIYLADESKHRDLRRQKNR